MVSRSTTPQTGGDATPTAITNNTFQVLFSKVMRKEEIASMKKFKAGDNFDLHLKLVQAKFEEMQIEDYEKISFLFETLHDRVKHELFTVPNYKENKSSLNWITTQLKFLFQPKTSKVNSLVELLTIKQLPQQKVRDFMSAIRVEAWRLMGDTDDDKREEYCVTAFIDGLHNRRCRVALKQLSPKTLEEAYSMIKHEDADFKHQENIRVMANVVTNGSLEKTLSSMNNEIRELKIQVSNLVAEMAKMPRPTYADKVLSPPRVDVKRFESRPALPPQRSSQPVCYNCNTTGHIARHCTQSAVCRYCKVPGHNIFQCTVKPRERTTPRATGNLRNLRTESVVSDAGSVDFQNQNRYLDLEIEGDEIDDVATSSSINYIECGPSEVKPKPLPRRSAMKGPKRDVDIAKWSNFIEGNGARPRKFYCGPRTVISQNNRERAANKPIVPCTVNGEQKNVFFDSGSENNVIDEQFACNLGLRIVEKNGQLNCANATPLRTKGYTFMRVTVGSCSFQCKFIVAEKIFPNVFVGLRTMKNEGISIHPQHDCIVISGKKVPFLSKVESENY